MTQQSRSGWTMLSKLSVETFQGNEPTLNSSGNTRPQSSQVDESLCTDPGLKIGIGVRELISTSKQTTTTKRSAGGERMVDSSPKVLASREKAITTIVKWTRGYIQIGDCKEND